MAPGVGATEFCEQIEHTLSIPQLNYDCTVPKEVFILGSDQSPHFSKLRTGTLSNFPKRGERRRAPDIFIVEGSNPPKIDAVHSTGIAAFTKDGIYATKLRQLSTKVPRAAWFINKGTQVPQDLDINYVGKEEDGRITIKPTQDMEVEIFTKLLFTLMWRRVNESTGLQYEDKENRSVKSTPTREDDSANQKSQGEKSVSFTKTPSQSMESIHQKDTPDVPQPVPSERLEIAATSAGEPLCSSACKIVDSSGGTLNVVGATLRIPSGSLRAPTKISISMLDPVDYYPYVINAGLTDAIRFTGRVVKLEPHDQKFLKSYTLEVALKKTIAEGEQLVVFHSNPKTHETQSWEVLDFKHVHHLSDQGRAVISMQSFSYEVFTYCYTKVTRALSCFGMQPTLFRIVMFLKNSQPCHELRLVLVADDAYRNNLLKRETVVAQLEQDGFKELKASNSFELMDSDQLQLNVTTGDAHTLSSNGVRESVVDLKVWQSTGMFVGYEVYQKRKDDILSIEVQLHRIESTVQQKTLVEEMVYKDDMCSFLQEFLELDEASNLMPIATKLGITEERKRQLMYKCWDDNGKQLGSILDDFRQRKSETDITSYLKGLKKKAYAVSERGSMHVRHLRGTLKFVLGIHREEILENPEFQTFLLSKGHDLLTSVLHDCCVELLGNGCPDDRFAEVLQEQGKVSDVFLTKLREAEKEETRCDQKVLQCIVPELIQLVKDVFSGKSYNLALTGMRGLNSDELHTFTQKVTKAKNESNGLKIHAEIIEILSVTAKRNQDVLRSVATSAGELSHWVGRANIDKVLHFLGPFFQNEKGVRLKMRMEKVWHRMLDRLRGAPETTRPYSLNDIEDVALSLLKFVTFSPEYLLQFQVDPVRGKEHVYPEKLRFKDDQFSQRFLFSQPAELTGTCIRTTARIFHEGNVIEVGTQRLVASHNAAKKTRLYLTLKYSVGSKCIAFTEDDFQQETTNSQETERTEVNQIGRGDHDDDHPREETVGLDSAGSDNAGSDNAGPDSPGSDNTGSDRGLRKLNELDPEKEDHLRCHLKNPPVGCSGWKYFAEKEGFAKIKIIDMEGSGDPEYQMLKFLYAKYPTRTVLEFCEELQAPECNGKVIAEFLKTHISWHNT